MSHGIWSFASHHTLTRVFCSAAQFWSRMQEEARVGWGLTSIPAERLRMLTPLCSMLGKTIFLNLDFHREALSTTQRKCPIQFPSLFPGSLTLEFTALKSWILSQTFLLLNSNYSGYYWFKVQHIMIAILISMLVFFFYSALLGLVEGDQISKFSWYFVPFHGCQKAHICLVYFFSSTINAFFHCCLAVSKHQRREKNWHHEFIFYWEPTGCLLLSLSL